MNKKVIISLVTVAIVVIVGICVAFAVFGNNDSKNETTSTTTATKATQVTTQAQTEQATEAPTQAQTEMATEAPAPQNEEDVEYEPVIPNVIGVWKSQDYPDLASVQVVNQAGNTIDIIITSLSNNEASKIATAKASVTLDVSAGSSSVSGSGTFEYTDSFGNSGTGIIGVNESVIALNITEEYNSGSTWGISNTSGKYLPPYSE